MRKIVLTMLAALLLTACPEITPNTTPADKYRNARTSIIIARAVLAAADTTFLAVAEAHKTSCVAVACIKVDPTRSAAYTACLTQDPTARIDFQKCYGSMGKAVKLWPEMIKVAFAALAASDQSITLAEQLEQAKGDKRKIEAACALSVTKETANKDNEYEKCVEQALSNNPVTRADWQALLKTGLCVAYSLTAFFPKEWERYVIPTRLVLKGYGRCVD